MPALNVENEDEQLDIYQAIIAKDLSVRQVEDVVRKLKVKNDPEASGTKSATASLPEKYQEIQDNLAEKLDTDVNLVRSKRGKGKIVIPFKNDDEFERILSLRRN